MQYLGFLPIHREGMARQTKFGRRLVLSRVGRWPLAMLQFRMAALAAELVQPWRHSFAPRHILSDNPRRGDIPSRPAFRRAGGPTRGLVVRAESCERA